MVKKVRARQEVMGSNPSYHMRAYIFSVITRALGTGSFTRCLRLSLWSRLWGTGWQNRYPRPSPTGAIRHFSSSVWSKLVLVWSRHDHILVSQRRPSDMPQFGREDDVIRRSKSPILLEGFCKYIDLVIFFSVKFVKGVIG